MTNRAYEWIAEGEREERDSQRKRKGRHVRRSRLAAWWRRLRGQR